MPTPLSGPGVGLPLAQNLYPSELYGAPGDVASNRLCLAPGDAWVIPAGTWYVNSGTYGVLQYLDPVTGVWAMGPNAGWNGTVVYVKSDGFTTRVANLLCCPVSATITNAGGSYVQATTLVTATPGNSTWAPIVGGALALSGTTLVSNGAGYGVAPIVPIPAPPPASANSNGIGGVQATAYAVISSGTVSGITLVNSGAGYMSGFTTALIPNPTDPNIATGITNATAAFTLTGSGQLRAVLCTNPGAPLADPNLFTLTVAGAGTNASCTGNVLQTVQSVTVSGAGSGFGTISALLTTVGGVPGTGAIATDPNSLGFAWRPRPAQVGLAVSAAANGTIAAQNGVIYDGGLFLTSSKPNYVIATNPIAATTVAIVAPTLTMTMGSYPIIITAQPAP